MTTYSEGKPHTTRPGGYEGRKEKAMLNECISSKGFASLILDYEWPDMVSCRVLIEDLYQTRFHAANRAEAIEIFRSGKWRDAR